LGFRLPGVITLAAICHGYHWKHFKNTVAYPQRREKRKTFVPSRWLSTGGMEQGSADFLQRAREPIVLVLSTI
jgi:hypothetical protein